LLAALIVGVGLPPFASAAPPAEGPAAELAGAYSFLSPDPLSAGDDMLNVRLTLDPDGSAHLERVSAPKDGQAVTADGSWSATGDEVQLVLDQQDGAPLDDPQRYTIPLADGFPTGVTSTQGEGFVSFGPVAFALGSGDVSPLVPRLNQMLARVDHVDFRDPGPGVQRFGEPTRRAVAQFQATHGLLPTGLVDQGTWQAMRTASSQADPNQGESELMYTAASTPSASDSRHPIYFTFDDGPSPSWTQEVMEVLARYSARATFFMVGQEVQQYPDVVRDVVKDGHYVADHTWAHESLEGMSQEEFVQSVESTRQVLMSTASDLFTLDGDVAYLRPPYGATDETTREYAAEVGMQVVMWDLDPMDWREPGAPQIATYVLENAYPGAIVLMHDGGGDRSQTVAALETILPELAARGYWFPTIFDGDPNAQQMPGTAHGSAYFQPSVTTSTHPEWVVGGTDGAGANLRELPSTQADVVAVLPEGTPLQLLEGPVSADGLWWRKVRAEGTDGWIAASYVRLSQSTLQ
jgi:peptidoglycan/xylan/chitin deacetylase (PgdA/CDA1 family)